MLVLSLEEEFDRTQRVKCQMLIPAYRSHFDKEKVDRI